VPPRSPSYISGSCKICKLCTVT